MTIKTRIATLEAKAAASPASTFPAYLAFVSACMQKAYGCGQNLAQFQGSLRDWRKSVHDVLLEVYGKYERDQHDQVS